MIELNQLDNAIIYKNKIDPLRIFKGSEYTIELNDYIIYLIDSNKEVPQELFSEITKEERYKGKFPYLESICAGILNSLVKKGFNIEDEKYNDILLGVQSNDSMAENFVYGIVREDFPFPLSFAYIYEEDPKASYYIFRDMVNYDYTHKVPDFIIEAICMKGNYIIMSIKNILESENNKIESYFKYIDIFMQVLYNDFNKIIDRTKDLKNILKDSDTYSNESKIFFGYIEDLKWLLKIFIDNNVIDKVDVFLDFLKTKKFQDHINVYLNFKFKYNDNERHVKELKDLLSTAINFPVKESFGFKAFFNR